MAKWICSVCGYVFEGENPPEACPQCKAPASKFVKQAEGEMAWAAEHVVGVAQGAPEEILEGLRMNFQGECTEVGMYLAMARVAHREGYPEIGLYWGEGRLRRGRARRQVRRAPRRGRDRLHQERTSRCALRPRTAPPPARPSSPSWPSSSISTPSTTPSTRWPATRPVTAVPSPACLKRYFGE